MRIHRGAALRSSRNRENGPLWIVAQCTGQTTSSDGKLGM